MTDKKSSESRRKLLKSIAAGSGAIVAGKSLSESWSRPVVDSVLLPAHAQTSSCDIAGDYCFNSGVNFLNTITVLADGTVNIVRQRLTGGNAGRLWTGSGSTANGALGGDFTIQVALTFPVVDADPTNVRDFTGTVVCDRTEISGTFDNPNNLALPVDYLATDGACPPVAPSDIRLKSNIEALSNSREGYSLYKFQYIDENNENTYVGVMAQDIISRNPEAVIQNEAGFYMVRYAQLGLKMVTLKQWESEGPDSVELMH